MYGAAIPLVGDRGATMRKIWFRCSTGLLHRSATIG